MTMLLIASVIQFDSMIIYVYKNILIILIKDVHINQFCDLFEKTNRRFISDNGVELLFSCCEKSEVIIEDNLVSIFMDLSKFDIIAGLFKRYFDSDRRFPLDISLEQLGFSIESNEIEDVVFECGQFNDG